MKILSPFNLSLYFLILILNFIPKVNAQESKYINNINQYIENTEIFEENQIEGHTVCIPASTLDDALNLQRSKSKNYLSLNGEWKFHYAEIPEKTPDDFYLPKFNDKKWATIIVPSNWEMQGFGDPLFRNISQPFQANPPFVPKEYNPTGSYRKVFTVPNSWKGKEVFLRMEKTASASFLWINGKELGYNEGAHEPAEYNITCYLKPGKNTIAVHVLKYSDGVYLESQDYWRLAGIFDDVWLYATPKVQLFDWYATTNLDANYENANLDLQVAIKNHSSDQKINQILRTTLFDGSKNKILSFESEKFQVNAKSTQEIKLSTLVIKPLKWSAENPNLYYLTMELIDQNENTDQVIAGRIGFKETEIRNQVFYLNGKPIKLNGTNSHMQHPVLGHTMDEETMHKDFILLKQFNINCVRTSHYPPSSRYLELADEYGIYIIDETGDEAHATEYISEDPGWEAMYRERARKMVLRDRNHPSILFWSAGNESGEGENICAIIEEGRKYDPSRYWMYGGNAFSHPCEDIIGPRYPTPTELKLQIGMVSDSIDSRPSFMDEYIAVTGNSGGGLDEFWEVINEYPRIIGGAIWDYVSPGLLEPIRKLKDSSRNNVPAHIMGRAKLVDGHVGKGIDLNGHDQWIEIYQDKNLEIEGDELTLSLWVFPRSLIRKGGTFLTKGSYQFGLQQIGADSIDFYIYTTRKEVVRAALPENWEQNWHHVAGIYNGKSMTVYINGQKSSERVVSGNLKNFPFPVNIGRNSEEHGQETSVYLCDAIIDQVGIFQKAIPVADLATANSELKSNSAIWLDFENEDKKGEFYSYGIGARTYGSIWPDRTPQPEMWQIKKSAQPISVSWSKAQQMEIEVTNHQFFTNTNSINAQWNLLENGISISSGKFDIDVEPRAKKRFKLPVKRPNISPGAIYMQTISFHLKENTNWAPEGFEIAWDQLEFSWEVPEKDENIRVSSNPLRVNENKDSLKISGTNFSYVFNKNNGRLLSIKFHNKELIKQGPKLNIWRAPLANETDAWGTYSVNIFPKVEGYGNMVATGWYALGLDRPEYILEKMKYQNSEEEVIIHVNEIVLFGNSTNAGFENEYTYTLSRDGKMETQHLITPFGIMPVWLPRIGTEWIFDRNLKNVEWFGRGPQENYPDRKTGYKMGVYSSTVEEMFEPYLLPEDFGLRTENRWVKLVDDEGIGLKFSASNQFNFNCYNYSTENLSKAKYPYQLMKSDGITFNFDYQTTGVGGTARSVLNHYQTIPQLLVFKTIVMPIKE